LISEDRPKDEDAKAGDAATAKAAKHFWDASTTLTAALYSTLIVASIGGRAGVRRNSRVQKIYRPKLLPEPKVHQRQYDACRAQSRRRTPLVG